MTAETFFQLFNQYGLILVCAVVFCEYMNLPGFPAGVIMPCVGVLIARSELSLPLTVFLSVIAGVLGSLVIKPEGKPTLVPASDRRPAISTTGAKQDFTDYKGEL